MLKLDLKAPVRDRVLLKRVLKIECNSLSTKWEHPILQIALKKKKKIPLLKKHIRSGIGWPNNSMGQV